MGITLYKASHRSLNTNQQRPNEQYLLRHRGQQHIWLKQNTVSSSIKSRPVKNSRRAVLKMLGKIKLLCEGFISIIQTIFAHLVAVVIAFFICWAPFHTQRITAFVTRLLDKANKNITSEAATKFQEILFFASGTFDSSY